MSSPSAASQHPTSWPRIASAGLSSRSAGATSRLPWQTRALGAPARVPFLALPTARSPLTATDLPPGPDAATWANVGACRAFRWAFPALTALAGGLAGPGACGAGPPHAWSVVPGGVSRRSWSGRFVPPFSCCGGPISPSRRIPVALGGQGPPRGRKGDARDPGWVMSADGDGCEWRPACFCVPLGACVAHDRRLRSPTWLGRGWGLFSLPSGAVRGPRDVP